MAELSPSPDETKFWETLDSIMQRQGIHCGMPLGIFEQHITTSFKPLAAMLAVMNPKTKEEEALEQVVDEAGVSWKIHRTWETSRQWKGWFGTVVVLRNNETGKFQKVFLPRNKWLERYNLLANTLVCRARYTMPAAEVQAQRRLFEALSKEQRETYIVTDAVVEKGRSGLRYLIRKNRPTLAVREIAEVGRVLCALCLHPAAYYTETWAGVMPPSDEVLAHLLMIRGDEHFYWRQANQIPPGEETSGI